MDSLIRTAEFRATSTDGSTLEGYAAVFDSPTSINSWEGRFTEIIRKGAFARSVRANPRPIMQFDHGQHPYIGSIPIGAIEELREDEKGLFVRAKLHSGEFFAPVREAIASGSITGMSFKFTIPDGGVTVKRGDTETHIITDVDLHELGPVVWPAYKETSVGVRMSELAEILRTDETARHELIRALVFEDLTDRSETEEPTTEPDDTSPEGDLSEGEVVRDEEPVPSVGKQRRLTQAAITAAKTERALRYIEQKETNA